MDIVKRLRGWESLETAEITAGQAASEIVSLRKQLAAAQTRIAELEQEVKDRTEVYDTDRAALLARIAELREALEEIATWKAHTIQLAVDYGSQGVQQLYRDIARETLSRPDDLTALREAEARVLEEVISEQYTTEWTDADDVFAWLRRLAAERRKGK